VTITAAPRVPAAVAIGRHTLPGDSIVSPVASSPAARARCTLSCVMRSAAFASFGCRAMAPAVVGNEEPLGHMTPDELSEHQREAAKLNATLAVGIIAGAATTMAAATALLAFSVGNFEVGWGRGSLWTLAYAVLFVSAACGGFGLRNLMREGAEGRWTPGTGRMSFSLQAFFYLVGVVVLACATVATFSAERRTDRTTDRIERLSQTSSNLAARIKAAERTATSATSDASALAGRVRQLESAVAQLRRDVASIQSP
jgi:hypothetical protein